MIWKPMKLPFPKIKPVLNKVICNNKIRINSFKQNKKILKVKIKILCLNKNKKENMKKKVVN